MENLKVKTWGVPFWTPGTVSDLAWSRTVDSQGHRVCVVSEAPQSFMWANYCALLSVHLVLCPVLKKRKKKVNIPVCTSEIPLPMAVGLFRYELGRLGYYCSILSPPAVKVGSGQGSQPIDETLGLGKRCRESFGVCLRCAILGDLQHIFTKSHLLWNVTVLMKVLWKC